VSPRDGYTVVCLARHGIGPEMMAEASRALTAVSLQHGFHVDERHVPFGADALTRFGRSFPLSSRSALLGADAVLVAAKSDTALRALEADLDLRTSITRVRFEGRAELSILAPLGTDAWEWTLERAFSLACESRGRITLVGVDESWESEAERLEQRHDGLEIERLTPQGAMRPLIFTPERFDVVVCTPRWLDRWIREDGPLIGRHHLIVERWDAARIRLYLTEAVESEEAPTWPELGVKIGRIGKWEFEDYRP